MFRKHNTIKERLFIVDDKKTMDGMNEFLTYGKNAWVRDAKNIDTLIVHYLVRYEI